MSSNDEAEVDPFGAFGEDSDSDRDSDDGGDAGEQREEDPQLTKRALALKQIANQNKANTTSHNKNSDNVRPQQAQPDDEPDTADDSSHLQQLEQYRVPPDWDAPKYLSPHVQLVSALPSFGGGRGFVALRDFTPGSLVLVEDLLMAWPHEQLGKPLSLSSVKRMLHHPNVNKIVHCLEAFHPTKQAVDSTTNSNNFPQQVEDMMQSLRAKHQQKDPTILHQIVQETKQRGIQNKDASDLSVNDVLRLFLALQYNGLESGLYCYIAMFNHHCRPNCVKFLPGSTNDPHMPPTYSEVRTTRYIKAGESLTISYMPSIQCHASRRHHLWHQHKFDIGTRYLDNANTTGGLSSLRKMELIHGELPPSSIDCLDDTSLTSRIEHSLDEMNLLYQYIKESLLSTGSKADDEGALLEQAKALEVSSLELYTRSKQEIGNDQHLLLLPCLLLHLESCDVLLRRDAAVTKSSSFLSHSQRCKLLGRTVGTALKVLNLQKAYWGGDHFDVARTSLDLSQGIEELLTKSPKHLFELSTGRTDLKGFPDWSRLESDCRKEHKRIKELYPQDAMDHVQGQQINNGAS